MNQRFIYDQPPLKSEPESRSGGVIYPEIEKKSTDLNKFQSLENIKKKSINLAAQVK